jgi:acetyl-CoA synthetase
MAPEIESVLQEARLFPPPAEFARRARVRSMAEYEELARRADQDPELFWAEIAAELHWHQPWSTVLEWSLPDAKWFVGGKTNLAYNCLDRHLGGPRRDKPALVWEGEPGDQRILTYAELHGEVCRFANALVGLGVKAGDRVAIYMPLIPETAVAMLACARIGATHSVVFGGFAAEALADRIRDAGARIAITADGGWRRGQIVPLKDNVDAAVKDLDVEKVVVVRRCGNPVAWQEGRDLWWHELVEGAADQHEAVALDSEHPLFTLYTSGTTGKPKGIMHTTGGYMVGVHYTTGLVFDLRDDDIYWCSADVGWVTGHSYVVYGPLLNGATSVLYEGAPNHPDMDRFWKIIEKYKVSVFYTAPTAIRAFSRWGEEYPGRCDLSSLRLLGTVGEPINPEAWMWYRRVIGGDRCPIVDTWWQTETGAIMISPLPGVTAARPGSAMRPVPGISAAVVDDTGTPVEKGSGGYLVLTEPWPSMLRGIWGDPERYKETYWSRFEGVYFAGDGAKLDEDGNIWVLGRVDDVMNVSGHRMSTAEIESALVSHPKVAEAAVVGAADETTGQAICAFVILREDAVAEADEEGEGAELIAELRQHVAKEIGPIAKPRQIMVVPELPKTRSGKIMRRLLKDVAEHREVGDVTTLADSSVMNMISAGLNKGGD